MKGCTAARSTLGNVLHACSLENSLQMYSISQNVSCKYHWCLKYHILQSKPHPVNQQQQIGHVGHTDQRHYLWLSVEHFIRFHLIDFSAWSLLLSTHQTNSLSKHHWSSWAKINDATMLWRYVAMPKLFPYSGSISCWEVSKLQGGKACSETCSSCYVLTLRGKAGRSCMIYMH